MSPQHDSGLGLWGLDGIGKTPGPSPGWLSGLLLSRLATFLVTVTPRKNNSASSNYRFAGTNCAFGTHICCFLSYTSLFTLVGSHHTGISIYLLQALSTSLVSYPFVLSLFCKVNAGSRRVVDSGSLG